MRACTSPRREPGWTAPTPGLRIEGAAVRGAAADASSRSRRSPILPETVGVAILMVLAIGGAVATIRLLRLPWWWVLFPPFLDGAWNGNPQTLLVPLILVGAGPIAAFLKVYAIVPIVLTLRWRALLVTGIALVVTAPFLPWASYLAQFGDLSEALADASRTAACPRRRSRGCIPIAIIALDHLRSRARRPGWRCRSSGRDAVVLLDARRPGADPDRGGVDGDPDPGSRRRGRGRRRDPAPEHGVAVSSRLAPGADGAESLPSRGRRTTLGILGRP